MEAVQAVAVPFQKIADGFKKIGQDVEDNFRRFGDNIRDNIENIRNDDFKSKGATRLWSRTNYENLSLYKIRSLRKLLDIIERKYSHVSITVLLFNTAMEAASVGIYMKVQHADARTDHLDFDWGLGYFITLNIFSVFFTISWLGLLIVDSKKFNFLFRPSSIMFYLSAGWMLVLGAISIFQSWPLTSYCPMFFRMWWLHECILVLLDYPQISAFFTENKLEMARSLVQCFAVIGICVGILQAVESYYGKNPLDYFTVTYMMVVVFSTIGYGDVVVSRLQSRLLLILFIIIGVSYFVPLLEYVANLGLKHLSFKSFKQLFKNADHVIIAGSFETNDLRLQLENIFAGTRNYLQLHVVVLLPDQPEPGILLLLNAPKYRSNVTLLVGDPCDSHDLDRCNARGASAIFSFGEGVNSSYYSDYNSAKQATSITQHVPHVPLYIFLHRSRYTRSMIPPSARVMEVERLNHILLGLGSVLPGMIPLIGNLIRKFDPMSSIKIWNSSDFEDPRTGTIAVFKAMGSIGAKQREMFSYGNFYVAEDESAAASSEHGNVRVEEEELSFFWHQIYEASMAQQIVATPLPEDQRGRSFRSMAHIMYQRGITLIGVVRTRNVSLTSKVEIAPRGNLSDVEKLILISDKRAFVAKVMKELPPFVPDNPMDTLDFDDAKTMGALKELVSMKRVVSNTSFASFNNASFASAKNKLLAKYSSPTSMGENRRFDHDPMIVVGDLGHSHAEQRPSYKDAKDVMIIPDIGAGTGAYISPPPQKTPAGDYTREIDRSPLDSGVSGSVRSTEGLLAPPVELTRELLGPHDPPSHQLLDTLSTAQVQSPVQMDAPQSLPLVSEGIPVAPQGQKIATDEREGTGAEARPGAVSAGVESLGENPRLDDSLQLPQTRKLQDGPLSFDHKAVGSENASNPALPAPLLSSIRKKHEYESDSASVISPTTKSNKRIKYKDNLDSEPQASFGAENIASFPSGGSLHPQRFENELSGLQPQLSHSGIGIIPAKRQTPTSPKGIMKRSHSFSSATSNNSVTRMDQSLRATKRSGKGIVIEENAEHLTNHFVFVDLSSAFECSPWSKEASAEATTAKAADLFDVMRPARQHSPLTNIVLMANEENYKFLEMMWEDESSGMLTIVEGNGLSFQDLERCNFENAAAVVVFCAGERCDPHGDTMAVLTAKNIRILAQSDIPIVVELDRTSCVHLLSNSPAPESDISRWVTEPSFMSGTVVCRHMLDTCLQETFFLPEMMDVLEQILAGRQDALMVTCILPKEEWKQYKNAVDYCLDRRLLPMAVHRLHTEGKANESFRYIVTNPPPMFPLNEDDVIYCLKVQ